MGWMDGWMEGGFGETVAHTQPHNHRHTNRKKKDKKKEEDSGGDGVGGEMRVGKIVVPTFDELFIATGGKRLGALPSCFGDQYHHTHQPPKKDF